VSVIDIVARIDGLVEEHADGISSLSLVTELEREGYRSDSASAAIAYGVQRGSLEVDGQFRVKKRQARSR
jgi:hypothetical protein